ncbi:5-(carboxyamino)imidazole ribonucleotide mutase [Spelaeicoccus albus]|uniref:N5-carboxyaminoimidazole ribonucleotide mutase n=1 Tax=Spelaeicoccus albus TaxID=1280376 RepID=A0A7Z0IHT3_9MICO|nr:5-(carboxyamino)imidazole ribonucleotide mutase [Spelaeicoccus albus]NYI67925.1 phosphoribosylaminoimidazole carboxylase PurE protein [Spelaeicoccus albus]
MASKNPVVGIVMGSDSDWPVMEAAAEILTELDVSWEAKVVSAHRMPSEMLEYGHRASAHGLQVIIAGAGGAAHLPGMLAATTPLPVIGVPVALKNLDGLDSLLSIVQMPAGVPVATVSIDGARNAGLLAARILGSAQDDDSLSMRRKLVHYQSEMNQLAKSKGEQLRRTIAER